MTPLAAEPGDVLLIRLAGFWARWIRVGAGVSDRPDDVNHVAVVHHTDPAGTTWCIEGRPGGVGWADATAYLDSPWSTDNTPQPKTAGQRAVVCRVMEALLGTPYDWEAVAFDGAGDAAAAAGLRLPWAPTWHGTVPGHVVCSSAAAWAYTKAGLGAPGGGRECQPADWAAFITARRWEGVP